MASSRGADMAAPRKEMDLVLTEAGRAVLQGMSRSRRQGASRVEHARIFLRYDEGLSSFAVARALGSTPPKVTCSLERAVEVGVMASLDDLARPGKAATITLKAKAWLVSLACSKAKSHGYPHELWATRLLARRARTNGAAAGVNALVQKRARIIGHLSALRTYPMSILVTGGTE